MTCIICGAPTRQYFVKRFDTLGLSLVRYDRCTGCGFAFSRTHFDMAHDVWKDLNRQYHESYQGTQKNEDDPLWIERLLAQARALVLLQRTGILRDRLPWLDFACGDGTLGRVLSDVRVPMACFDRYMAAGHDSFLDESDLTQGGFDLVLSTSYLEHIRSLNQIEEMIGLVSPSGAFAFHTGILPEIPNDPSWFYLIPVHTSFYSNESMSRLFFKYNFKYCLYHADSRLWLWFKEDQEESQQMKSLLSGIYGQSFFGDRDFVNPGRIRRARRFVSGQGRKVGRYIARASNGILSKRLP